MLLVASGFIVSGFTASAVDDPADTLTVGRESYTKATETYIADSFCLPDLSVRSLGTMFDGEPGGIIGADYPRTLALENGNVLWTFQDARIRTPTGARYVHNIGMIQVGTCFNVLVGGSSQYPEAWLFPDDTAPEFRWFWPLDAEIGSDGQVYIFATEMNERGERYLERAEPGGVFVARLNPDNWNVEWYGRPADTSNSLYGWSIESDDDWTYLFAHCHRQFGYDEVFGGAAHDRSCTQQRHARSRSRRAGLRPTELLDRERVEQLVESSRVGRRPQGSMDHANPVPAQERTVARDHQGRRLVRHRGRDRVGGASRWPVRRDRTTTEPASSAATPSATPTSRRGSTARTWAARTTRSISSLSHNRWDGEPSWVYRPTYQVVLPPPDDPTSAMRCGLGHCR